MLTKVKIKTQEWSTKVVSVHSTVVLAKVPQLRVLMATSRCSKETVLEVKEIMNQTSTQEWSLRRLVFIQSYRPWIPNNSSQR